MENLVERRKQLSDPKILRYVDECIEKAKSLGLLHGFSGDDIDVKETAATHTFGMMGMPRMPGDNFTLSLSKYLFTEPEDAVKKVIYHELCHYVQDNEQLEEGVITYSPRYKGYVINTRKNDMSRESSHGGRWKDIAREFSNALGINITRTDDYILHKDVGKAYEDSIKYVIGCKRCGRQFKYSKRTNFVNSVLTGKNDRGWHCRCGSKDFEVIKEPGK